MKCKVVRFAATLYWGSAYETYVTERLFLLFLNKADVLILLLP